jgi:hypothetical protein
MALVFIFLALFQFYEDKTPQISSNSNSFWGEGEGNSFLSPYILGHAVA